MQFVNFSRDCSSYAKGANSLTVFTDTEVISQRGKISSAKNGISQYWTLNAYCLAVGSFEKDTSVLLICT